MNNSQTSKILLLEDDPNLGFVLTEFLEHKGYQVIHREDGEEGLKAFHKEPFDICIVDVMMPKMDGFTFTRQVRKTDQKTPIIFLTAKSMKEDKIEGFRLGGDDYITKPFSMEELEARVEAVLKRTGKTKGNESAKNTFTIGKFTFDYPTQTLTFNGNTKKLTTKEAELLKLLCLNANQILEREIALKLVWGNDNYFTGRSMDVYITKLRKYLKDDPTLEIMNIHGIGYKLRVPQDSAIPTSSA
ncbi:MAG: transcriptional regulatory protein RprY [Chitinophagales bacterium]|nr:MAG: transcriptional regulatory protein RprY [Chitinophagales bacterium]